MVLGSARRLVTTNLLLATNNLVKGKISALARGALAGLQYRTTLPLIHHV